MGSAFVTVLETIHGPTVWQLSPSLIFPRVFACTGKYPWADPVLSSRSVTLDIVGPKST
jgi:hypothetical protein